MTHLKNTPSERYDTNDASIQTATSETAFNNKVQAARTQLAENGTAGSTTVILDADGDGVAEMRSEISGYSLNVREKNMANQLRSQFRVNANTVSYNNDGTADVTHDRNVYSEFNDGRQTVSHASNHGESSAPEGKITYDGDDQIDPTKERSPSSSSESTQNTDNNVQTAESNEAANTEVTNSGDTALVSSEGGMSMEGGMSSEFTSQGGNSSTGDGPMSSEDTGDGAFSSAGDQPMSSEDSGDGAFSSAGDQPMSSEDSGDGAFSSAGDGAMSSDDSGDGAFSSAEDGGMSSGDSGDGAFSSAEDGGMSSGDSGDGAFSSAEDGGMSSDDSGDGTFSNAEDGAMSSDDSDDGGETQNFWDESAGETESSSDTEQADEWGQPQNFTSVAGENPDAEGIGGDDLDSTGAAEESSVEAEAEASSAEEADTPEAETEASEAEVAADEGTVAVDEEGVQQVQQDEQPSVITSEPIEPSINENAMKEQFDGMRNDMLTEALSSGGEVSRTHSAPFGNDGGRTETTMTGRVVQHDDGSNHFRITTNIEFNDTSVEFPDDTSTSDFAISSDGSIMEVNGDQVQVEVKESEVAPDSGGGLFGGLFS